MLTTLAYVQAQQQFSFGAAGDFGTGPAFQATVRAVKANNISLFFALGDLSYQENQETAWCGAWKTQTNITDFFIAAGNHDVAEDCCGDLQTYLNACPASSLSIQGDPGIQYYVDYPPSNTANPAVPSLARFIVISPGVKGDIESYDRYQKGDPGYDWVRSSIDDARANNIRWIFVAMHKNYISTLVKTNEVGADLMALLFEKKVDVVLQAHEHGYERSKVLTCAVEGRFNQSCVAESNPTQRGKGTTILVLGTGGMDLRTRNDVDPERSYFQAVDVTTYGFGQFVVAADRITYNFIRSYGGNYRDSFSLRYVAPPNTPTSKVSPSTSQPSSSTKPTSSSTKPTASSSTKPTSKPSSSAPSVVSTPASTPTRAVAEEEGNTKSPTAPTEAAVAEVNNFDYNGSAIIAVICLFLIAMALLGLATVIYMIRLGTRKHAQVGIDNEHVLEEMTPKKSISRMSKLNKKQSEGTIDYL